uniref:Putative Phytanoyl-CoA dioxygenase (PhyH) n=1 Tax=uncultured marine microorganism HF4000_097M14 TaxID=455520 RepID=B3T1X0_9ZZZZ|nr:putative Phytanoyl-CoA dioxygenase (PhyH) [uncultured marine microorganism HF4000_097M14]
MNTGLLRTITPDEVETYHRDGVLLLPGMFDKDWIELLNKGLDANIEAPTRRSRIWYKDTSGRSMFYDHTAWQGIEEYRKFIFNSPAAQICGQLMRSTTINFFFDSVFVRSTGTQFETPWHQDEPYWSVEGYDACSIWMPLGPVKQKNALSFVPGSHCLKTVFKQYNFGDLNPVRKKNVDQVDFSDIAEQEFPDINADPKRFGVVSWDMQPGDCIAFNGRTMHGGSGKLDDDCELRVFTTKWVGDDVRIKFRDCGMDPDHSADMIEKDLKPGDRPGTNLYPRIWTRV